MAQQLLSFSAIHRPPVLPWVQLIPHQLLLGPFPSQLLIKNNLLPSQHLPIPIPFHNLRRTYLFIRTLRHTRRLIHASLLSLIESHDPPPRRAPLNRALLGRRLLAGPLSHDVPDRVPRRIGLDAAGFGMAPRDAVAKMAQRAAERVLMRRDTVDDLAQGRRNEEEWIVIDRSRVFGFAFQRRGRRRRCIA